MILDGTSNHGHINYQKIIHNLNCQIIHRSLRYYKYFLLQVFLTQSFNSIVFFLDVVHCVNSWVCLNIYKHLLYIKYNLI